MKMKSYPLIKRRREKKEERGRWDNLNSKVSMIKERLMYLSSYSIISHFVSRDGYTIYVNRRKFDRPLN